MRTNRSAGGVTSTPPAHPGHTNVLSVAGGRFRAGVALVVGAALVVGDAAGGSGGVGGGVKERSQK